MEPFVFASDLDSFKSESVRIVEVPKDFCDKSSLLSWYAIGLAIPNYFGENWDAFDECLRDLSWIKERKAVLYHRGVPLDANPREQKVYVDVLASAVRDWKPGKSHELVVAFHPECELKLRAIAQ